MNTLGAHYQMTFAVSKYEIACAVGNPQALSDLLDTKLAALKETFIKDVLAKAGQAGQAVEGDPFQTYTTSTGPSPYGLYKKYYQGSTKSDLIDADLYKKYYQGTKWPLEPAEESYEGFKDRQRQRAFQDSVDRLVRKPDSSETCL